MDETDKGHISDCLAAIQEYAEHGQMRAEGIMQDIKKAITNMEIPNTYGIRMLMSEQKYQMEDLLRLISAIRQLLDGKVAGE